MAEKKRWVDGEWPRVDAVLGGSNPSGVKGCAAGRVMWILSGKGEVHSTHPWFLGGSGVSGWPESTDRQSNRFEKLYSYFMAATFPERFLSEE
jgi:hypothetical protein